MTGDECNCKGCTTELPSVEAPSIVPAIPRPVVAMTGLAGSGKSTAATHLVERQGFTRVRFAGPLKDMTRALGFDEREIEGDLKEVPSPKLAADNFAHLLTKVPDAFAAIGVDLDPYYEFKSPVTRLNRKLAGYAMLTFISVIARVIADGVVNNGNTPRRLMQFIGTEWGRNCIGETFWVDLWRANVDALPEGDPVVCDDCRFPNEADAVKAAGGAIVRVERRGAGAGAAGHSSETHQLPAVVTIDNHDSIENFIARVDATWRTLSWSLAAGNAVALR